MSSPRSPRVPKTDAQKSAEHDEFFFVGAQGPFTAVRSDGKKYQFSDVLARLVLVLKALNKLSNKLRGTTKELEFTDQKAGIKWKVDRRALTALYAAYAAEIKRLNGFYKAAKKGRRGAGAVPSSYKGIYSPAYAGALDGSNTDTPLRVFFRIGRFANHTGVQIQGLDALQAGFFLRNTLTLLFYVYANTNGLLGRAGETDLAKNAAYTRSDAVMNQAFGATPALYVKTPDVKGKTVNASTASTYAILSRNYDGVSARLANKSGVISTDKRFDAAYFKTWYFQNIGGMNYSNVTDLENAALRNPPAAGALTLIVGALNDGYRANMLAEHEIVKGVSAQWKASKVGLQKQKAQIKAAQKKAAKRAGAV